MLYKPAAYLVTLMITLHFTPFEAVLDVEKSKETVTNLFLGFISIALEFKSKNVDDLIKTANDLVGDIDPETYLETIAKDRNACLVIKDEINSYEREFQILLNEAQNPNQQNLKIPMIEKLAQLRSKCASLQGESSSQNIPTRLNEIASSLREILQTKLDRYKKRNEPLTDNFGFNIQEGKMKVKIMLGVLLKLATDKKCTYQIFSVSTFVRKMLELQIKLVGILTDAMPQYAEFILREIVEYKENFSTIVPRGSLYLDLLSTTDVEILRDLRFGCERELQLPTEVSDTNSLDQYITRKKSRTSDD